MFKGFLEIQSQVRGLKKIYSTINSDQIPPPFQNPNSLHQTASLHRFENPNSLSLSSSRSSMAAIFLTKIPTNSLLLSKTLTLSIKRPHSTVLKTLTLSLSSMAAVFLTKIPTNSLLLSKTLTRLISTFPPLSQEPQPQLHDPPPSSSSHFPRNPSSGSPFYQENWRNPNPVPISSQSLVPVGQLNARMMVFSQTLDAAALMDVFADWMASQQWSDEIVPNTASYNLVLKAMYQAKEGEAVEKLIDRMMLIGTMPDGESYNFVIGLLPSMNKIDSAFKYLELISKSGNVVSSRVFGECVRSCVNSGRLYPLSSTIEKCKTSDQNKASCPNWMMSNHIVDIALQADHSKLTFFALQFLYRWIVRKFFPLN